MSKDDSKQFLVMRRHLISLFVACFVMLTYTTKAQQVDTTMLRVREGMAQQARRDSVGPQLRQDTTITTVADTMTIPQKIGQSPKRAAIYSAILPGMGQAYNKRYWKIPIVYAGMAFGGYLVYFNTTEYRFYRDIYFNRVNNLPDNWDRPDVSNADVKNVRDIYNKRRQQSWVYTSVFYFVQVADAFVDAHLSSFDISDDLSVRPAIFEPNGIEYAGGIGLKMTF